MSAPTPCRLCNAKIWWKWGRSGRQPINLDGSDHRPTCTRSTVDQLNKEKTERIKSEGRPFEDRGGSGYIHKGKKRYFHQVSKSSAGDLYRRLKHRPDCNVPPWEECDCAKEPSMN